MVKLFKILGRSTGIILEWILILIIVLAFAVRLPQFQTFLAHKVTEYFSRELKTTISIKEVEILFFDRVALDGVLILDLQNDTIASINTMYATIERINLDKNFIHLKKAELDKGVIHINRDKKNGEYNYQFLVDYFSGKRKTTGKKPLDIRSKKLQLSDVNLKYDDYRKSYSKFGMDFDHLDFRKVYFFADDISSENGVIKADVKHFSATEKCGFSLNKLESEISLSEKGLKFDDLSINTPLSDIKATKLHMLMNGYDDFQTFVDSVTFDADLLQSKVSLKDVSYFATALEGMDQEVHVKSKVNNKVNNLRLSDLELRTGKQTVIKGTLHLVDFNNIKQAFFNEKIDYAYVSLADLEAIKLPVSQKDRYLKFDEQLKRLEYFEARDLRIDGFNRQFVVASDRVNTKLGSIKMDNGIMFTENPKNKSYYFEKSGASEYDVKIEKFQLGKFLNNSSLGMVDGTFFLSGEAFSLNDIRFNLIEGNLNRFDYLDYSYTNIFIEKGSFIDGKFIADIEVKDDNLKLTYQGYIDFKENQHMHFSVDLTKAILHNLNLTANDSISLKSDFTVDVRGNNPNNMSGIVTMSGMVYKEGDKQINIDQMTIEVQRGKTSDHIQVTSNLLDMEINGKVDFSTLIDDFMAQFKQVFPSIASTYKGKKSKTSSKSNFTYSITTKDMGEFLAIFAPDLQVAQGTELVGSFNGKTSNFTMDLSSSEIDYKQMRFIDVDLKQALTSKEITANYTVRKFVYNDSVSLDSVRFKTQGASNALVSELSWNPNTSNASNIAWQTNIIDNNNIKFVLNPSYFSINNQRWEIENASEVNLAKDEIHISRFKVQRGTQYITIDGALSRNDSDKLNFKINDLKLEDVAILVGSPVEVKGLVNGWGYISNPYTNLTYIGDASIQGLYVNKEEVGDVFVQSQWNKSGESIGLNGDLVYRGNQTFKFDGNYYLERESNSLDFNLVFDKTDIQFANAFLDPDAVNNIRGLLDGRIKVTGSPENPILEGQVELISGNAKIELLGANFGFDGKIKVDQYGFYMDYLPVTDEEGNTGALIGSVYHENFKDWNFDLQFDLENRIVNNRVVPLDKFLVMNTQYREGELYYGKAYVVGTANIFGYAENLEITVDVQTKRGTTINFPMYGATELSEEETFLRIKGPTDSILPAPKFDLSSVTLDMNFRLTPDAKMRIIFNEQTGDEINAVGSGTIAMKLDAQGDLALDGTYTVKNPSTYTFAFGLVKKPFIIEEGGTITWAGNPYNAILNLRTYNEVNASLAEISPDLSSTKSNQKIRCYIYLTETLLKPQIAFDIKAPNADESTKALLASITSNPDELNRQFFSLILFSRFLPKKGSKASGGNAALDLAQAKINEALGQLSKNYKVGVGLDRDEFGTTTTELKLSKGFYGDRLIVSGSFGVQNTTGGEQATQGMIGDVRLEYLLNETGTVRVNVFNESNDYSIIQDKNLGLFTQGAGLHYQEDFDNWDNFKLVQYFLDVFRKKENKKYPIKRKRKQTPVPPLDKSFIMPEEDFWNIKPIWENLG